MYYPKKSACIIESHIKSGSAFRTKNLGRLFLVISEIETVT